MQTIQTIPTWPESYFIALAAVLFVLVFAASFLFARHRKLRRETLKKNVPAQPAPPARLPAEQVPLAPPSMSTPDLGERLSRTRGPLLQRLGKFFGAGGSAFTPQQWEEVEEALLEGDVGVQTTMALLEKVKTRLRTSEGSDLRTLMQEESERLLAGLAHGAPAREGAPKPYVISVVGVNGAGKTTTIGKLAYRFRQDGQKVLLGAVDTFRAAAIGQLKVWAERADAQFVAGREGGDPGAVAFDSVSAGVARGMDVVLLDTAGRLHTKSNLMDELKKVHRVIKKVLPDAPHETWLVLDGTTGQNAVRQAQEFQRTLELTGIVITKLEGTAKGGAILAIAAELRLPIKFIGIGESVQDLVPFEAKPFIQAILGHDPQR